MKLENVLTFTSLYDKNISSLRVHSKNGFLPIPDKQKTFCFVDGWRTSYVNRNRCNRNTLVQQLFITKFGTRTARSSWQDRVLWKKWNRFSNNIISINPIILTDLSIRQYPQNYLTLFFECNPNMWTLLGTFKQIS